MTESGQLRHHLAFYQAFELRRLKSSPADFQKLFEDVMTRARPGFMRVRPYGREGDWKADGLFRKEDIFYQVYSPDHFRASALARKIEEDLTGAIQNWRGEMTEWHFVYNVRDGVPPRVPALLNSLASRFQGIILGHLSNDELWKIARGLRFEELAEILGPPVTMLGSSSGPIPPNGRVVVVHDAMGPVDIPSAVAAMKPDPPIGSAVQLWPWDEEEERSWERAAFFQERLIRKLRDERQGRFAVFAITPIPLAIHLGYVLSDRVDARLFQYDRDPERRSWSWPGELGDLRLNTSGLPDAHADPAAEVAIRISLSHEVRPEETRQVFGHRHVIEVGVSVPELSVHWLRSEDQLRALGRSFREVLQAIDKYVPSCPMIHLFYAGPVPGAVLVGQAMNPRTTPPCALYQYDKRQTPRHHPVLTLGKDKGANSLD